LLINEHSKGNDSNEYDKYDLNVKNSLYTSSLY
jgi:hypothetical protein